MGKQRLGRVLQTGAPLVKERHMIVTINPPAKPIFAKPSLAWLFLRVIDGLIG
jgi:hypothetical protein